MAFSNAELQARHRQKKREALRNYVMTAETLRNYVMTEDQWWFSVTDPETGKPTRAMIVLKLKELGVIGD